MGINDWWRRLRSRFLTLRAAAHLHYGNQYGDRESYQRAIGDLSHALLLHAENVNALVMRGTIYWRELAQADRAVRDLSEALRLAPAHWDALFNRALARHLAGDVAGALDDLQRYIDDAPSGRWKAAAERLRDDLASLPAGGESNTPGLDSASVAPTEGIVNHDG